jgi:hypothetical protein
LRNSDEKTKWRQWYSQLKEKLAAVDLNGMMESQHLPATVVNSEEEAATFVEEARRYMAAMRMVNVRVKEAIADVGLRTAISQLPRLKLEDLLEGSTIHADRLAAVNARLRVLPDEKDGTIYADGYAHLYCVVELVKKRMTMATTKEKITLTRNLHNMKMGRQSYHDFVVNVREAISVLEEAGATIDKDTLTMIVTTDLPPTAQVVANTLLTQEYELEDILTGLETHFRDEEINASQSRAVATGNSHKSQSGDAQALNFCAENSVMAVEAGPRKCFTCDQEGHMTRDCPRRSAGCTCAHQNRGRRLWQGR